MNCIKNERIKIIMYKKLMYKNKIIKNWRIKNKRTKNELIKKRTDHLDCPESSGGQELVWSQHCLEEYQPAAKKKIIIFKQRL